MVIANDPTTPGEIEKRQVLQTFVREADVLVDLHVDGEVISTTEEHPFWVVDQGWVEAEDLRVGDLLITEDGVIIDVDGIEKREGEFEVYNFEVEDFHTYFVSDLEVLVHNACNPAEEIHNTLPKSLKEKTVSTDLNINTLSGYSDKKPSQFTHVPATDVLERGKQIGHEFRSFGSRDREIPGQARASHAEVQLIVGFPNADNIHISKVMCPSCQEFFKKEAKAQGRTIIVRDPLLKRTFTPDGDMLKDEL